MVWAILTSSKGEQDRLEATLAGEAVGQNTPIYPAAHEEVAHFVDEYRDLLVRGQLHEQGLVHIDDWLGGTPGGWRPADSGTLLSAFDLVEVGKYDDFDRVMRVACTCGLRLSAHFAEPVVLFQ